MISKAISLLNSAKRQGVHISVNNGELQLKSSKPSAIEPGLLQDIKNNKEAIIDFLNNNKWKATKTEGSADPIKPYDRNLIKQIRLSFSQERLWFIDQLEGTVQYHLPTVLRLTGKLNKEALSAALQTVVTRHEVLRSVIVEDQGDAYQQVMEAEGWKLLMEDGTAYKNNPEALQRYIRQLISVPFNLSKDYMLRATLIALEEEAHTLVVTMHHIASDGWSLPIIVKEVAELYHSFVEGHPSQLVPLPIQYADFAIWQRNYFKGAVLEEKMGYWKEKLKDLATLQLPSDFVRPTLQSTRGATAVFTIEKELADQFQQLCQQEQVTIFMGLLSAFKLLLHRYSGQQDICVGTPIAGRQMDEVEGLVGFFVNTLALRTQVTGDISFINLLAAVKQTTMDAYQHQEAPFEKIVEWVVKERDMSRSPVFQVLFALQQIPGAPKLQLPELVLSGEKLENNTSKFDISFYITETANGLQGSVEYCTGLYKSETIARMIGHYKVLLDSIVKKPAQKIGLLPMLTSMEAHQLQVSFNDTSVPFPSSKTVVDLFEEQVLKTPASIAVVFEDQQLSYEALNKKANGFAHYLRSKGVKEETLVPICIERSLEMIIGLLAILKAGATFVPIDPEYPEDRIRYMLEDTGASMVVSSPQSRVKLPAAAGVAILELTEELSPLIGQPATNLPRKPLPHQLAYTIYTSGSTGKPKGVMIEHRSLVNLLTGIAAKVNFDAPATFLSITTYSFDIAYLELYLPLIYGGRLILVSRETAMNGFLLAEKIAAHRPTHLQATPSAWQILLDSEWENKEDVTMLIGGEAVKEDIKDALTKLGDVYNCYGPTETTIWSVIKKLSGDEKVVIGKPVANTSIAILDANEQLCPICVAGEICIGGAGLARGYFNRPELTAEKFIKDPFSKDTTAKLYRTGDLGRWLPDGNIECLGRLDDQVKIRGFRIELGEIETVLEECASVAQAVVAAKEDKQFNKRLIAYIVPNGPFQKEEIINYLKGKLPGYMVPAFWVEMESLPLTPNGKINRKALPDPDISRLAINNYVAAGNEMETMLVEIWQRLLGVERIGIHDNFFELGGHSLLAMRVVSATRKEMQVELAIKDLFANATIAALAAHLQKQNKGLILPPLEIQPRPEHIPLSFSQERLWFIDRLEGTVQYHLPIVLRLKGRLNIGALSHSIQTIVARHEVLRTVILEEDGIAYQHIRDSKNWELKITNASAYPTEISPEFIQRIINVPFDLAKDYMLRVQLIVINETEHVLVVTMHHIASDGWSISLIVQEFAELYNALEEARTAVLPVLPVQYADYAIWQRKYLQGTALDNKIIYWKNKLMGVSPLQLPADYARPAIKSNAGARSVFHISKELSDALQLLGRQQNATLFMTLLAAFKVLLHRYTGQEDICVGTPVANRTTHEVEELIGFFVNTLALRTEISEMASFTTLLQQVRSTTMNAYQHQDTPFEKVVDAVVKERDLGRSPVFQVMFALQNTPEIPPFHLGALALSRDGYEHAISKFDITLTITETPTGLHAALDYCTALFNEQTILTMISHFKELLISIIQSPDQVIGELPMLGKAEEQQLLAEFNDSSVAYPADKTIIHLFEEQADKHPSAIAVVFEQEQFTYAMLNKRASQLANYLRSKGVKNETLVPVCFHRGLDMIVAILGILKAGGAYVPIDPDYPEERIAFLLEDTAATMVLSNTESSAGLQAFENINIIELDNDQPAINVFSENNLQQVAAPHNLAYVIYTSGSTGKPKGVMIEHRALLDHCFGVIKSAGLSNCKSFALFAPLVFDAGHSIIHASFILGSALHVLSKQILTDGEKLTAYIDAHSIDCVKIVPSLWLSFADTNNFVLAKKVMIFGGDSFSVNVLDQLVKINYSGDVYNHYGPTEAAIGKTIHKVDLKKRYAIVPIGKPFSNTSIFIVNKSFQLVPVGVPGELYIAGEGLARGYLNNPVLTAEKFITNPFSSHPSAKMYKTGDQARWLPDGDIEYLGRIDEQVKIRGFRIEPGEIETAVRGSGFVQQVVVASKEAASGSKVLVGYIVPEGEFNKGAMVAYLKNKLPEYMIPSLWVTLQQIPLTSNGKIDKKALPAPDVNMILNNPYLAPRTPLEQVLANTWQKLLGVQKVGVHDNFFELGGDSVITIQVVSRARQAGYEFQVADIFTHQTIARLAAVIEQRQNGLLNITAEQQILSGGSGLLPIQQRFFEKEHTAISHFNQSVLLQIDKRIDAPVLNKAVQYLFSQHDALRFKYFQKEGQWYQQYGDKETVLITDDLSGVEDNRIGALITEHSSAYQRSLDIEKGDQVRMVWIKTPATTTHNRLLIVLHHLVADGVSWRILLNDLDFLLSEFVNGGQPGLGHKTSSYRQWYHALEKYGQGNRLLSQAAYWQKITSSYHPLPEDMEYKGLIKTKDRGFYNVLLDADQTNRLLHDTARLYHTEINDLLLCALYCTLEKRSGQNEIIIGLEGHGRQDIDTAIDTTRTVGWFSSHYPLLLAVAPDRKSIGDCIKSVKEQLRQVADKGLGYGVLKYINREPSLQGAEPWDIVFNYLGQLDNVLKEGRWLKAAVESAGATVNEDYLVSEKISVNAFVQGGQLQFNWGFSKMHYHDETITELAKEYIANLEKIIAHCAGAKTTAVHFTPSDYGLAPAVAYNELDDFLNERVSDKTRREITDGLYRLSGLQQGILFHSLYETGFGTYIHQFGCDLTGTDLSIFRQSWNRVLANHSILRSAFFHDVFSVPVQCVYKEVELPVALLDFRQMDAAQQAEAIAGFENADRYKSFDYKTAPLMRLALIQVSDNRYRMIWTWHHILFDGWSMPILMEEFLTTYEALVCGNTIVQVEEDCYEDYIRYVERGDKQQEENYWRNYLKGVEESTLLPFIGSTNERTKGAGVYGTLTMRLDATQTALVQRYAQSNRITLNTVMQGVWSCLLRQYTGNENVVFGVIVSGRPDDLPGVERRVGLYINAVPLHTHIRDEEGIASWLQTLQVQQVASRQYQYTPLSDIQAWAGIPGELFDNLLVFDNYPVSKIIGAGQWSLQVENTHLHEQNNYPLSIVIVSNPEQITIQFLYNTALIQKAYINNLRNHFEQVLLQMVSNKVELIGDINFLTEAEENQLLLQFNDTSVNVTSNNTVVDLFEEQVVKTPHAIAIVFKEDELTYHELNERANRLAGYLQSRGVKADSLVPVCIEKSNEMIIGILGILKAGGAYVPIDPEYPTDRIKFMLDDTAATIVVSSKAASLKLQGIDGIEIIELNGDQSAINNHSGVNVKASIAGNHLAYVIYTSGSTGKPKGVIIEHRNLIHYLLNNKTKYISPEERGAGSFIHLSSTFDASITAMFMPLLSGKMAVIGYKQSVEVFEDSNLWKYAPYDFIKITPSHLELLQPCIKNENGQLLTNRLVIGGEALTPAHFNYFIEKKINLEIINEYGPTEATVGCSVFGFHVLDDKEKIKVVVPIGKPLDNVQLYVINEKTGLVPVGVSGEICIGGNGLARGYVNLPGLTSEKFIADPFNKIPGRRMYKTGDLGRWLPDGNMEFLGRKDDQLKLNGYRIEPGEIESAMSSMEGVANAKVVVKETSIAGSKKLNAYLQIDKEKLPLLNNYLGLINKKQIKSSDLNILPNGLPVLSANLNEVRFLYNEIFEDHCYLKHGISLNEDSCVMDVGANVGFFTVFLNILSKNIKVYSVEPIPDVYNYLVANRQLYGIKGKAFQLAVSDKEGEVDFTWYPQVSIVSGMSNEISQVNEVVRSYIENSKKEDFENEEIDSMLKVKLETRQIRCKTKTLSQIIQEEKIEKIDLLKIDVENSEHLVMGGILEKDWDKICSVIIEVHDVDGRLQRIRETLEQKGFTTYMEKEKMLSKDDILYNLFALKNDQPAGLASLGNNEQIRTTEWSDPTVFVKNIQAGIAEKLPAYMVPANIILLDQFPLTNNGKLDKNALPDVEADGGAMDRFVAPRNELEEKLTNIWEQVLEVEKVGVHDDFFALGGDSLLSIRLVSAIRKELEVELAISTFFELITIEKVANYIKVNQEDLPARFENYEEIEL